jgi:dTDP-4-dehydrorhamnose reductase
MTNVLIFGANGMLGSYATKYLSSLPELNVTAITRNEFDVLKHSLSKIDLQNVDVVINCVGTIKPLVTDVGVADTTVINALFPHRLANYCAGYGVKLIHITTDCVFSGAVGFYNEIAPHDPLDVYGKTKSLGEPRDAMIIRTSIIGEEVSNKRSLIEWVKSNDNKTVSGYTNHTWNGLTCLELSKFIASRIINHDYWEGVRHVFSPTSVTKMELVTIIAKAFNINLNVIPTVTEVPVYRTLSTVFTPLITKEIEQQVNELPGFFS